MESWSRVICNPPDPLQFVYAATTTAAAAKLPYPGEWRSLGRGEIACSMSRIDATIPDVRMARVLELTNHLKVEDKYKYYRKIDKVIRIL